jgi:serine/threonine protein kinase
MPDTRESPIGRTLNHYAIVSKMGEGAMGVVYRARDERLGRFVALKIISTDRADDEQRARRFVQEAKAASALNHPNIVTVYDVGVAEDVPYMAMECVEGSTLHEAIGPSGLPVDRVVDIAVQLADA